MLEHIQRLPVDVLERFLEVRDAKICGIPQKLAEYIIEINDAYNLNKKYRSITECARQLRMKYPDLSLPTCKSRIYDSIRFFNADCSVTASEWDNYFADHFMDLADVNMIAHNFTEVRRCWELAHKYRSRASANIIDPKRIQFKHQIVSPDVHLSRMGITPTGILRAYERAKAIIKSRDISQAEQNRLVKEVERELNPKSYTEYEEIEN